MGRTKQYETLATGLEGKTHDQLREVTRALRRLGLWPRDGTGGGKAAHEVPIAAVANRILSVGAATLPGIGPYLAGIGATRFRGTQHDAAVVPGSRVDRLLNRLAVQTPDPGDQRQTHAFIRGADLSTHEIVTRILDAISVTPDLGEELDVLRLELELISGPPPFELCAVFWLHEDGERFGWNYLKREPTRWMGINQTPTRVLVRSVKIPAAWFREYAALLTEDPSHYDREEAA